MMKIDSLIGQFFLPSSLCPQVCTLCFFKSTLTGKRRMNKNQVTLFTEYYKSKCLQFTQ